MHALAALIVALPQDDPSDATREQLDQVLIEYKRGLLAREQKDRQKEQLHLSNAVISFEKALRMELPCGLVQKWARRTGEDILHRMFADPDPKVQDAARTLLILVCEGCPSSPLFDRWIAALADEGEKGRKAQDHFERSDSLCFNTLEFVLEHPDEWWVSLGRYLWSGELAPPRLEEMRGLRLRICAILVDQGDDRAISVFERLMHNVQDDPHVRYRALSALHQLTGKFDDAIGETLAYVKRFAEARSNDPDRIGKTVRALDDEDPTVRDLASRALHLMGVLVEPDLREILKRNPSTGVKERVQSALRKLERGDVPAHIMERLAVIDALRYVDEEEAKKLLKVLDGPRPNR